ncbi:DUF1007 family protein [Marimonas arenosa]|nr:DUF1007 family protein [Marimonas arenosa]
MAALSTAAAAHPHIFVSTGLTLVRDEGRLVGVEVVWQYDEFYSLLVLEDMGLDADYDGTLTDAELAQLDGFDMNWIEGFAGDLYAMQAGRAVRLGPPERRGTTLSEGKITSRHFRPVEGGTAGEAWTFKPYDPTFYTAYDMGLGVSGPDGCEVKIVAPDIGAAQEKLLAELAQIPEDGESDYPQVGEQFAETVVVTCAAGS